jgi:hypothetical protein
MSPIPPALDRIEWHRLGMTTEARLPIRGGVRQAELGDVDIWTKGSVTVERESLPALIAILNDSLPITDARKITRKWIDDLDWILQQAGATGDHVRQVDAVLRPIRDALESYLPPPDDPPSEE